MSFNNKNEGNIQGNNISLQITISSYVGDKDVIGFMNTKKEKIMVFTLKIILTVLLVKINVKKMINVAQSGVDQRNPRSIHLSMLETVYGGELENVLMTTTSTLMMDITSTKDILATKVQMDYRTLNVLVIILVLLFKSII